MPLVSNRYGKGRVRVMRIHRDGERHDVSELYVKAMIEGEFAQTYTLADNSERLSTDTIKNVVNVVARENPGSARKNSAGAGQPSLDPYPQSTRPRSARMRPNGPA